MRVAIITSVSQQSSRELAEHLQDNDIEAKVFQPWKDGSSDFRAYDYVFSYGCSAETQHKKRINSRQATLRCVDKVQAFKYMQEIAPIPRWWTEIGPINKDVETLVIRQDRKGRKAEDLSYWYRESELPIPHGDLYTEYFEHKREYRVTVFMGNTWVYFKNFSKETGMHTFNLQRVKDYPKIVDACNKAAKAIGIDYASFDVVAKTKEHFVILEANSGTILTEEVSTGIVEYFINL